VREARRQQLLLARAEREAGERIERERARAAATVRLLPIHKASSAAQTARFQQSMAKLLAQQEDLLAGREVRDEALRLADTLERARKTAGVVRSLHALRAVAQQLPDAPLALAAARGDKALWLRTTAGIHDWRALLDNE
jgi:hypothetical protein